MDNSTFHCGDTKWVEKCVNIYSAPCQLVNQCDSRRPPSYGCTIFFHNISTENGGENVALNFSES